MRVVVRSGTPRRHLGVDGPGDQSVALEAAQGLGEHLLAHPGDPRGELVEATAGAQQLIELAEIIESALERAHFSTRAQQAERMRRIGVLMGYPEGDPQAQANVTALLQGLQSLG